MIDASRNSLCTCGSGLRFKHCHGAISPVLRRVPKTVLEKIREMQREEKDRVSAYGHARPIVSTMLNGQRVIATYNRLEVTDGKTPVDFFGKYIKRTLGRDGWGNRELLKPLSERHPILQWYNDVCIWQRTHAQRRDKDGIFNGVATGSVAAYYSLAYDLWTLDNYAALQELLLKRIKNREQYQGARYELYVAAAMIRAGFQIEFEDESDVRQTHCEMTIIDPTSKRRYSVEAKTTGRAGMLGKDSKNGIADDNKLKIYRKLQDALLKKADHRRIIFIDVNMPPHKGDAFEASWFEAAADQLGALEKAQAKENPYPPAYIFFTNHPYHYIGNEDVEPGKTFIFTAINDPALKQKGDDGNDHAAEEAARVFSKNFPEIDRLVTSVFNHTKFPTHF